MASILATVVVPVLLAVGCDVGCGDQQLLARPCHVGDSRALAELEATDVDDLALVPDRSGAVALWSEPRGAFAAALDRDGRVHQPAHRIAARCEGGMAGFVDTDGALWIACSEPRRSTSDKGGAVTVLIYDGPAAGREAEREWAMPRRRRFRPVGEHASAVEVLVLGGRPSVVWQDSSLMESRIWTAAIDQDDDGPTLLSDPRRMAFLAGGTSYGSGSRGEAGSAVGAASTPLPAPGAVAWNEAFVAPGGERSGAILIQQGRHPPRAVATVAFADAAPFVVGDLDGRWLAYRDKPSPTALPQLYLTRLDGDLELLGDRRRFSRANGLGPPRVTPCEGGLLAVSPQEHGRRESLLGIRWISLDLRERTPETQLYEAGHRIRHAAVLCLGGRGLILASEQGEPLVRAGRLFTTPVRCQ